LVETVLFFLFFFFWGGLRYCAWTYMGSFLREFFALLDFFLVGECAFFFLFIFLISGLWWQALELGILRNVLELNFLFFYFFYFFFFLGRGWGWGVNGGRSTLLV